MLTESIAMHKENIQELHYRYHLTHEETLKELSQQERDKMFVNRVQLELYYKEKEVLPEFIDRLLMPIQTLIGSSYLEDVWIWRKGYS